MTRPWPADDGPLLRVRLPGGRLTPGQWEAILVVAEQQGDGDVHLTSRANVQLRAVTEPDRAAGLLAEVGLLPRRSHDLVRNVLMSPLTGRSGGLDDLRPLLRDLDAALLTDDRLAALPGKFLLALDDGRGDVTGAGADLGYLATAPGHGLLVVDGRTGPQVARSAAAAELLALAHRFLDVRGAGDAAAWHVRELPGGAAALLPGVGGPVDVPPFEVPPPGPLTDAPGVRHVVAPDGVLPAVRGREIARGAAELVITPWRSVLVVDEEER